MDEMTVEAFKQRISTEGRMPFSLFMQEALYGPRGYYSHSVQIGGAGADFYTASRLPLFGWTLSSAIEKRWQLRERPAELQVIEFGAGQGELADHVIEALRAAMPDVQLTYAIMDVSSRLIEIQQKRLAKWSDSVDIRWGNPDPNLCTVLLANEVLDALAVERVKRTESGWERAWVDVSQGELQLSWGAAEFWLAELAETWLPISVGEEAEICPTLPAFFERCRGLAEHLTAIFIDYGITLSEWRDGMRPNGTLRGYLQHELVNPLQYPGVCDITADVHWDYAMNCARKVGFRQISLDMQGSFLMREGISNVLENAWGRFDEKAAQGLTGQFKQLVLPGGMGERFMVMACDTYGPDDVRP